ncbi:MarR family winged helix-turn-helix transcriptional regulator [Enterococcus sp. LJL98]
MDFHQNKLGFHIRELSLLLSRKMEQEACSHQIAHVTHPQAMVIHLIYHQQEREIYQKDIEEALSIRKPTASQLIDRMEKSGLVERHVSTKDKRRNQIVLTAKAIESTKKIHLVLEDIEKQLKENLSEDDLSHFLRVVETMKTNIQ